FICLSGSAASTRAVDGVIQTPVQITQRVLEVALLFGQLITQQLHLVGQVQCGQYRDAVDRGHTVVATDLAHPCIEHTRGGGEAVAFVRLHANGVITIKDADADRFALAHVCCSSDLRRVIIASTRERACSFLASSCERSAISCSCCWRRLRFSSASRWLRSNSNSRRAARACSWAAGSKESMACTIGMRARGGQDGRAVAIDTLSRRRHRSRCGAAPSVLQSRDMTELPAVDDILNASQSLDLGASPAELHGGLCGWLAAGGADLQQWPAKVLADDNLPVPEPDSVLDQLRLATVAQLEDRDFAFELVLADPAAPLQARTDALFDWCRAFLGGFGLASGKRPLLSGEGEEALQDLARLAQASSDEFDSGDEDEDALAEIEEFVRVAVLLLHGDCVMGSRHRQRLN